MKQIYLSLICIACAAFSSAQVNQSLPVDPDFKIGVLDNGLTYYICHNELPENQASFYIAQRVGSILEEDNQRGLAHFLEHMAFNGTKHFHDDRLIRMLETYGVEFGNDLNAYTSIDETVYNINNVPVIKYPFLVDSCLQILADWSGNISLENTEIDKERGVIESEYNLWAGASYRMMERAFPYLYPDNKYGKRLPIGSMDVVKNFSYQDLKDYYHKWYRPDQQAIIVVGDIDPAVIEQKIKSYFSQFSVSPDCPERVYTSVQDNSIPIFVSESDKECKTENVDFFFKLESVPFNVKSSYDYFATDYMYDLISTMINMRFAELSSKSDCPYTSAYAYFSSYIFSITRDAFSISAQPKTGQSLQTISAIMSQIYSVVRFGFSDSEFQRAHSKYISDLKSQLANKNQRKSDELVSVCVANFINRKPLLSLDQKYQLICSIDKSLTVEQINILSKKLVEPQLKNSSFLLTAPKIDNLSEVDSNQMKDAALSVDFNSVKGYVDTDVSKPLIAKLPKPVKIASSKNSGTFLGSTVLTLKNGAKVVLKKTDFKNDEINFYAFSFGGNSVVSDDKIIISKSFDSYANSIGLGEFSSSELDKKLMGSQAYIRMGLSESGEWITGSSDIQSLETMLSLVRLAFENLGKDTASFSTCRTAAYASRLNQNSDPSRAFIDSTLSVLYNGNIRSKNLSAEDILTTNYSSFADFYKDRFADPQNFIYFVEGSIDIDTVKTLFEKYIANLSFVKRNESYNPEALKIAPGKRICKFQREMLTPQSQVVYFYSQDVKADLKTMLTAQMAGDILSQIYFNKIREESQCAYSAGSRSYLTSFNNGYATNIFTIMAPVKPEFADSVSHMMVNILNDCALNGVEKDKLALVKENFSKTFAINMKDNNFTIEALKSYYISGLDIVTDYEKVLNSITLEDIQNYLRDVVSKYNCSSVVMTPEGVEQI